MRWGGWWKNKKKDERARSMLDLLRRQRPLSACCVQAASAYLQQHLLAGRGLLGAGDSRRMGGESKAGEEIFLIHSSCWLYWGGLG